jgi:hypothetical protein
MRRRKGRRGEDTEKRKGEKGKGGGSVEEE